MTIYCVVAVCVLHSTKSNIALGNVAFMACCIFAKSKYISYGLLIHDEEFGTLQNRDFRRDPHAIAWLVLRF